MLPTFLHKMSLIFMADKSQNSKKKQVEVIENYHPVRVKISVFDTNILVYCCYCLNIALIFSHLDAFLSSLTHGKRCQRKRLFFTFDNFLLFPEPSKQYQIKCLFWNLNTTLPTLNEFGMYFGSPKYLDQTKKLNL